MSILALVGRGRGGSAPEPPPEPGEWEANRPAWATGGTLYRETLFASPTGAMLSGGAFNGDGLATTADSPNTISSINSSFAGPYSASSYRTFYAGGDTGAGVGGTSLYSQETPQGWRRTYFCIAVYLDSNYRMHATGGEKFYYPRLQRGSSCMLNWGLLPGSGQTATGPTWGFYLQPQVGDENRYQSLNGVYMTKGEWNIVECEMEIDTPGNNNGVLRIWINGANAINWTDVNYSTNGSQDSFNYIFFNSVRGGPTDSGTVPTGGQSRYYNRLSYYASTSGS